MENLDRVKERAQEIRDSVKGALPNVVKQLELASGQLPTDQDFHFYSNFKQFKNPVKDIQNRVVSLLSEVSAVKDCPGSSSPLPADSDEAYDWLVGVQDNLLERVEAFLDKSEVERKESKEKKLEMPGSRASSSQAITSPSDVKVVRKGKDGASIRSLVPFHIRSIPRPQDKFDIAADNSYAPFKHPCRLDRNSQDEAVSSAGNDAKKLEPQELTGSTHPLEVELRAMASTEPLSEPTEVRKPKALEDTPFTFVDNLRSLRDMSDKLRNAAEIAVDLENHHYRSYQGFVCLMQVSTRDEDFVVDTLAVRSHIGPCLGDVFSHTKIRKVMHGADRDIIWLQRDFGIYVCNMFDTGQAARILQLPSAGLAFLLEHFCGVIADKRYQLADWRIRPLPAEMMKYAREDTHYLLYIHDLLKQQLHTLRTAAEFDGEDPWVQVCWRSRNICLQLYTKEVFTETSFLQLNGLYEKQFRPDQLAAVAKLYAWRDRVARMEDESTGYVLPNHLLFQLASEMPENMRQLQEIAKFRQNHVGRNAGVILKLIREAKENPFITPLTPRYKPGMKDLKVLEEAVEKQKTEVSNILEVSTPMIFTSEDGDEMEGSEVEAFRQETGKVGVLKGDAFSYIVQTPGPAVVSRKVGSMLFGSRRSKSSAVSSSPVSAVITAPEEPAESAAQLKTDVSIAKSRSVESGLLPCSTDASIKHFGLREELVENNEDCCLEDVGTVSHAECKTPTNTPAVILKGKTEGFGASLFGRSRQQSKGVGQLPTLHDQVEARLRVQAIESSIALPFKTTTRTGNQAVSSDNLVKNTEEIEAPEDIVSDANSPSHEGSLECEGHKAVLGDVVMLENWDGESNHIKDSASDEDRQGKCRPHTGEESTPAGASGVSGDLKGKKPRGFEASGTSADQRDPPFPPSLSETHQTHRRRKRNRGGGPVLSVGGLHGATGTPNSREVADQRKKSKIDQFNSGKVIDLDSCAVNGSFSYAEARKQLGLENLFVGKVDEQDNSGRGRGKFNKKPSSSKKNLSLGFDALRKVRVDPKPEGIPKAPRRQVYSITGNRSATFKK